MVDRSGSRVGARAATLAEPPEAGLERSFALAAFIMNRHLVDHMVRSARTFGIDYQMLVLWAVLSHQNVAHLFPPGSRPSTLLADNGRLRERPDGMLRPVRLRHLSEMTGVPRETARRKLAALRRAGWITATPRGWIIVTESIDERVRKFTLESLRRFLAAAADVQRAVQEAAHTRADG